MAVVCTTAAGTDVLPSAAAAGAASATAAAASPPAAAAAAAAGIDAVACSCCCDGAVRDMAGAGGGRVLPAAKRRPKWRQIARAKGPATSASLSSAAAPERRESVDHDGRSIVDTSSLPSSDHPHPPHALTAVLLPPFPSQAPLPPLLPRCIPNAPMTAESSVTRSWRSAPS